METTFREADKVRMWDLSVDKGEGEVITVDPCGGGLVYVKFPDGPAQWFYAIQLRRAA